GGIRLSDSDLIALVNLRVLSEELHTDPVQVLQVWEEMGDFIACHRRIRHGGLRRGVSVPSG
ncbi:hypothetical protein ACFL3S_13930, partial [Gemmatimonadota bacterium]